MSNPDTGECKCGFDHWPLPCKDEKPPNERSVPKNEPLSDALALVEVGPRKTTEWVNLTVPMCRHCQPHEDVDQAAARILAGEVRRLTAEVGRDSDRLDWLMRNISGKEARRLGIFYSAGCTRKDLDRAMTPPSVPGERRAHG